MVDHINFTLEQWKNKFLFRFDDLKAFHDVFFYIFIVIKKMKECPDINRVSFNGSFGYWMNKLLNLDSALITSMN